MNQSTHDHASLSRLRHRIGGYSAYEPTIDLAEAIEGFWTYGTPPGSTRLAAARHRVLPDPSISLAFCCRRDEAGRTSDEQLLLVGEKTRPKVFSYEQGRQIAAVRIKLEWIESLLGLRPGEHADADQDLSCVLPAVHGPLLEALSCTRTPAEALETFGTLIRSRRHGNSSVTHAVVAHALDVIRATRGRASIEQVGDRAGFSERHMRRLVSDSVGLSLKGFARATRFVAAITAADCEERPSWALIAAEAGYYDQSHLVRDCQETCGMTPSELARERRLQDVQETPATAA